MYAQSAIIDIIASRRERHISILNCAFVGQNEVTLFDNKNCNGR